MSKPPVWIEVDLDTIKHNVRVLKSFAGQGVKFCAVLKSDAYGHGLDKVADAVLETGVDRIGFVYFHEARLLRRKGCRLPLVRLVPLLKEDIEESLDLETEEIVSDFQFASELSHIAVLKGRRIPIHINVDTGMGRKGILYPEAALETVRIAELPNLEVVGVMTHMPSADEPQPDFAREQIQNLLKLRKRLENIGVRIPIFHAANSAGTIAIPESRLDMVRPGLSIYGQYPMSEMKKMIDLREAMSVKTRVVLVRELPQGWSIGYGRTYVTSSARKIATLPVGYNDGYGRMFSNKSQVLIKNSFCPVVGRVSMNLITVDVTHLQEVSPGDEVVLMGKQGNAAITGDDLANWAGTINYDICTRFGSSLPKYYR